MLRSLFTLALVAVPVVAAEPVHWSFRPLADVRPPAVANSAWLRSPLDRFVLAKLEAAHLVPVASAGKRELIRRATFDLTGLPPTPGEVEAFLADEAPNAFNRVVERLLASPAYGERWGRHWLDVARYAEDQAHTFGVKPNTEAWRYRDWVINALNDDVPFDRFVKLQLAADLMELPDAERRRHLPALGFIGLGAQYYKNSDAAKAAADELDDRVDTLARGLFGLTVSCARCHDHKFDPIPTSDYYSLAGVFANTRLTNLPLGTADEIRRLNEYQSSVKSLEDDVNGTLRRERARAATGFVADTSRYLVAVRLKKPEGLEAGAMSRWTKFLDGRPKMPALADWLKLARDAEEAAVVRAAEAFQQRVAAMLVKATEAPLSKGDNDLFLALFGDKGVHPLSDDAVKNRMDPDTRRQLADQQSKLKQLQQKPVTMPQAHAVMDAGTADLKISQRGDPAKPGETAPRRFLRALSDGEPARFKSGSGRRELADCIANASNPLFARVIANRVWAWHFGRGIVGTPSNFGRLGEAPTHPELLDFLAARLVESGWSIKALHRLILGSATYQSSCDRNEANESIDADNRLLWRMNRRRLDVESWRDAVLAVSGRLDDRFGGPTFDLATNLTRRTVYAKVSRHNLDGMLRLFDFPEANLTCERRTETTVPQQQLFALNAPLIVEASRSLANRLAGECADDPARVRRLFELALGRPPVEAEAAAALRFLSGEDLTEDRPAIKLTRWERLAQAILSGNEFMYID